jgi:hypothetical protein
MQSVGPLTGIEASTSGIKVLLAGFAMFPSVAMRLLVAQGVIAPKADGQILVQEHWFALDSWLAVHEAIRKEIGPNALFTFGTRILENPKFPPWIRDVDTALESIDVAYHRSHRKGGVVMYDESTGTMLEGIGHYRSTRVPAQQRIEVTSDTPYPCEVDFGIVTRMANKFEPKSRTVHDPGPCRRRDGSSTCTYVVTW